MKNELLYLVSLVNSMNIYILVYLFDKFNIYKIGSINFTILPTERLNDGLSYLLQYLLPIVILNYLLIFRKNRYLKLIEKYPTKKNNSGKIYVMSVIAINLIVLLIGGLSSGNFFKV